MLNILLDPFARADINQFVGEVLADLGNPDPPLDLTAVRDLRHLSKEFYSASDFDSVHHASHALRLAGQQVVDRPTALGDIIQKLGLKALILPDARQILLDSSVPNLKQRWSEAHEIGHDLIPWHAGTALGDTQATLSQSCHAQIEAEANYAAGQLLFLGDRFTRDALSLSPGMESVRRLRDHYGNTLTATLWRYVELSSGLVVGAISGHPHRPTGSFSRRNPLRYLIRSQAFAAQFGVVTESEVFNAIREYCSRAGGGLIGSGEVRLFDLTGLPHLFHFETFFNRHEALSLGCHKRALPNPIALPSGHGPESTHSR